MSDKYAIVVENLHKSFRLPHEQHSSLKQTVLNWHKRSYEEQVVLKDISFKVKKGEFFGIVGRNGSGKSTLLKTIAGIYQPNKGTVMVNGRLTPFIELGIGFNPELTGRDNVFLNGAILGLSRKEIGQKYDEIVEFAELEKFMDQKLKNYSSGMQVRLAFSIAIQAHNEMLLIDEVLAVGDASFQRKCFEVFKEIKQQKKTVIFVSHDMSTIEEYCDRAILVHDGRILYEGKPQKTAIHYDRVNFEGKKVHQTQNGSKQQEYSGNNKAKIDKIYTRDSKGNKKTYFEPNEIIEMCVEVTANEKIECPLIGMQISNSDGVVVFGTNNGKDTGGVTVINKGDVMIMSVSINNIFTNDTYSISAAVKDKDRTQLYNMVDNGHKFDTSGWSDVKSLVHIEHSVNMKKKK